MMKLAHAFALLFVVACGSAYAGGNMPTGYNGNGSIPFVTQDPTDRVAIAASTNASPIVIQTSTTPGFNTGDTIEVEGHFVNTAANGVWQITVVDTTHFSLNGSTGNGVGVATGKAIDYEIQPAFQIPAPGESASMVTLAPVLEGLANLGPFLNRRAGTWRIYDTLFSGNQDKTLASTLSSLTSITANSDTIMPGCGTLLTDLNAYNVGDVVTVEFYAASVVIAVPATTVLMLGYGSFGASSFPQAGWNATLVTAGQIAMKGQFQVATAAPAGLSFGLLAYSQIGWVSGSGHNITIADSWSMHVTHYRQN